MIAWLGGRSAAAVTFGALIGASVLYRSLLIHRLFTEEITPFSFVPSPKSAVSLVQHLAADAAFAAACAGLVRLAAGRPRLAWGVVAGVLGLWGLAAASHYDLVFALHEGLGWLASTEGLRGNFSLVDIRSYATPSAVLLALFPALAAAALRYHPTRWSPLRGRVVAAATAIMVVAAVPARFPDTLGLKGWQPKTELRRLPLPYWLADSAAYFLRSTTALEQRADSLPPVVSDGAAITDPAFIRPVQAHGATAPMADGPWNVLVVILESVSARRAFEAGPDGAWPVPMPFLAARAREGLSLADHRSTSNSSARAIFSILSGLYPMPHRQMLSTRPGLEIPSLASWLDASEAFLVTPSRLQSYFPRSWLQTTGLSEMYGFDELPKSAAGRPQWPSGRNELDAVDFFVQRLGRAKEGFLGVYYSYAPHYHYYDYGERWQIAPDTDDPLHRYVNNLRLLDGQIGRLFGQLRDDGRLDRTAVVLVGDHGEAFGEHEGNWTHSRHSFEENLRTPAILWQPRLFPPGRVQAPTTHVDLLPTLLHALGRPVAPPALQGVALAAGATPGRTYTFSYGNEDTLTSVRWDRRKVQWRRATDTCVVFDLGKDPAESAATTCPTDDAQVDALLRYERFQRALLLSMAAGPGGRLD